ncbi:MULTISPECIES: Rpn family recombination-promoting nuclease/putative transposase [unclassified Moorena]|uniref:Rpn family recombination-promoting nuclease/putative transposase n=1 Tax=unclassified Moorena TaxID=2683338 RepID=UPI0013FF0EF5|nr:MULTISPECIES: Rpn family recombination-promoting nuclease/putative transposase [unclassified Moorena]NEO11267.1 Rpn family recombination-promoting nuclease/putative transposase [Moorena sp. SIO3E8]NEP98820.1 Rpn family recombination-promoting nuclease/putative transposase [Moorena sp. SIO3F7]
MFDNTCKFLAESFSEDFASWLLGEPITMTQLSPSELSLEPIRADALILLNSDDFVLHVEFQTQPDSTMAFRMADYRLRVFRRFPNKQMRQVVIYLTSSTSELVYQTAFEIPGTRHEFEVIRLWEQPTQPFLESTGLLPLAVLTQTPDAAQTLRQVAARVEAIPEMRIQSNVAACAGILAGLLLKRDLINQVLRTDIMQQSVIYQDIKDEGRHEGEQSLILRLLLRRIGEVSPEMRSQVQALSLPQLEALGEALLDFTKPEDLDEWMRSLSVADSKSDL